MPCMDGGVLRHEVGFAGGAHLLGQVGILHIHEVVLIEAAYGLELRRPHGRKAAGAELDLNGSGQILPLHQIRTVIFLPEFQKRQLAVDHRPQRTAPQRQALGTAIREAQSRPGHHSIRVGGHPVGQIAEGIGGELDVRVQDEVIIARQLRQDGVVSGAETAVLPAAAHLDLLAGLSAQSAALHGGFQTCAAAVGAGVVHQIEGQRVAAGVLQHRLRRLEGFVAAVIDNDTGREFQVRSPYHSSGNIFRLKSSRWMSKLGLVQGSPAASRSPQRA